MTWSKRKNRAARPQMRTTIPRTLLIWNVVRKQKAMIPVAPEIVVKNPVKAIPSIHFLSTKLLGTVQTTSILKG